MLVTENGLFENGRGRQVQKYTCTIEICRCGSSKSKWGADGDRCVYSVSKLKNEGDADC